MKIEVAKQERMSETGSSLIRLIQNNEMPILDLMVRETVQNSLDAALPGEGYVQVDFSVHSFNRDKLALNFEGISDQLKKYYPDEEYDSLEIKDSYTCGLTGPIHDGEIESGEYGNLIKLIYQVGMPQQKEGSGGSWGLGKTVYFRLGIGLVIYYSRIEEYGIFVSRLAACLVEDESKSNSLLGKRKNHRGIAWWGQSATGAGISTKPITDEYEINQILESIGTKPYTDMETGTTVIIPFLKKDLVLDVISVDPEEDDHSTHDSTSPWWNVDITSYIAVALQRWYAPRLMNQRYAHGRWLRTSINGEGITRDKFLPVFSIIQNLYNETYSKSSDEKDFEDMKASELGKMKNIPIKLKSTFKNTTVAGWIVFTKVSKNELLMGHPHNQPSPWVQVFGRNMSFENNPALITYTRKPGMLVGYEYGGKWIEGITKTNSDEFVIGLFVANSINPLNELHPKGATRDFLLEEYIRGCEKADHTSWADWIPNRKNPLIIERIQRNIIKGIVSTYSEKAMNQPIRREAILGRMLANILLPSEGFGRMSTLQRVVNGKVGISSSSGKHARFNRLSPPIYMNNLVRYDFELHGGKQANSFSIKLKVLTESGDIDANAWEEGIGNKFPISISKVVIDTVETQRLNKERKNHNVSIGDTNILESLDDLSYCIKESERYQQPSSIEFKNTLGMTIRGSLWIASHNKDFRAAIHIDSPIGGANA